MLILLTTIAHAEDPLPADHPIVQLDTRLERKTGDIPLLKGKAVMHVPDSFGYVNPKQTDEVLQGWGNPPSPDTEGMLLPTGTHIYDPDNWAVIISFTDDGHVADDDAAKTDWTELLGTMKDQADADSKQRVANGMEAVRLVGWAEPPHYDAQAHKLYWAKDLEFSGADHTVNYAVRVLGRTGVLEFNAVAGLDALGAIKAPMEEITAFSEFSEGNRYADYNASTDKLATYGIAALVAGGLAAKGGLFKGLIALLIAGKKVIIVATVALLGGLKTLFGGKKEQPPAQG